VVVTGISRGAAAAVENAFALGAVDYAFKYQPGSEADPDLFRQDICAKVKAASAARVMRVQSNGVSRERTRLHHTLEDHLNATHRVADDVVVVGASTGGTEALQRLLESLPADYSAGILVVQHMPAAFSSVVASRLSERSLLPVREAQDGDAIPRGVVMVAPGDSHLLVGPDMKINLDGSPPIRGHRPCIDVTMQSVAAMYRRRAMGILLTGEGDDGTQGLAAVQAAGGKTFAQSPDSCVVPAMTQRAIERGVVDHVGTPEALGMQLKVLT
jgi:two-component system chemotaxis response regulator CheB